jgi:hypothetical protein
MFSIFLLNPSSWISKGATIRAGLNSTKAFGLELFLGDKNFVRLFCGLTWKEQKLQ